MKRNRIAAKCGNLRLWFNRHTSAWNMTGGQWGTHRIYETSFNERVNAHWKGYAANNGLQIMAENMPTAEALSYIYGKESRP